MRKVRNILLKIFWGLGVISLLFTIASPLILGLLSTFWTVRGEVVGLATRIGILGRSVAFLAYGASYFVDCMWLVRCGGLAKRPGRVEFVFSLGATMLGLALSSLLAVVSVTPRS